MQNARGEEYKISQEEQIETLSPTEREALESAIEELQQQQTQNQSYFGKQPDSSSDFQKAFEDLM